MQESKFLSIFHQELEDSELNLNSSFRDHPKWTSLVSIIIINEIEAEFGVVLEVTDIKNSNTISDLFKFLVSHSVDN